MREARKALRGHSNGDGRGGRGCKMGVGAETWPVMVLVIQLSSCWTGERENGDEIRVMVEWKEI